MSSESMRSPSMSNRQARMLGKLFWFWSVREELVVGETNSVLVAAIASDLKLVDDVYTDI